MGWHGIATYQWISGNSLQPTWMYETCMHGLHGPVCSICFSSHGKILTVQRWCSSENTSPQYATLCHIAIHCSFSRYNHAQHDYCKWFSKCTSLSIFCVIFGPRRKDQELPERYWAGHAGGPFLTSWKHQHSAACRDIQSLCPPKLEKCQSVKKCHSVHKSVRAKKHKDRFPRDGEWIVWIVINSSYTSHPRLHGHQSNNRHCPKGTHTKHSTKQSTKQSTKSRQSRHKNAQKTSEHIAKLRDRQILQKDLQPTLVRITTCSPMCLQKTLTGGPASTKHPRWVAHDGDSAIIKSISPLRWWVNPFKIFKYRSSWTHCCPFIPD